MSPGPVSTLLNKEDQGEKAVFFGSKSAVPVIIAISADCRLEFTFEPAKETSIFFDCIECEAKGCPCRLLAFSGLFRRRKKISLCHIS